VFCGVWDEGLGYSVVCVARSTRMERGLGFRPKCRHMCGFRDEGLG